MGQRLHEKNVVIANAFFIMHINFPALETGQFDFSHMLVQFPANAPGQRRVGRTSEYFELVADAVHIHQIDYLPSVTLFIRDRP